MRWVFCKVAENAGFNRDVIPTGKPVELRPPGYEMNKQVLHYQIAEEDLHMREL